MSSLFALIAAQMWSPQGLPQEMYPIAEIESSFGKNLAHKPSERGELWTAVGALGIIPITAFESLKRSGYAGDEKEVVLRLQQSQLFYNRACLAHWYYLRDSLPDLKRVVYAWRWGLTAALKATEWQVAFDTYVLRYFELRLNQPN
jgi:hypothetical protein